jgi:hypothetical protein
MNQHEQHAVPLDGIDMISCALGCRQPRSFLKGEKSHRQAKNQNATQEDLSADLDKIDESHETSW